MDIEIIESALKEFNKRDKNWRWNAHCISENEIQLEWEYLKEMKFKYPYFTIIYYKELDFYEVRNEHKEDITNEVEDNTSLKETLFSVFGYAINRY